MTEGKLLLPARLVLILAVFFAAAQSEGARAGSADWCNAEPPPGPWKGDPFEAGSYPDIWPIRPGKIGDGLAALRNVTSAPLSAKAAAAYLGPTRKPGQGRYYLVRGSVYAPAGASADDLFKLAQTAKFFIQWFPPANSVDIVTWQPAPLGTSQPTNIPLILKATQPVTRVYVGCFAIR